MKKPAAETGEDLDIGNDKGEEEKKTYKIETKNDQ